MHIPYPRKALMMDGKVDDRDWRERQWCEYCAGEVRLKNGVIECDNCDRGETLAKARTEAFAAGRQAGLKEAAEAVGNLPWDESRVGNGNFDDTKEYAVEAITALIEE